MFDNQGLGQEKVRKKSPIWFRCGLCGHRFPIALWGFSTTNKGELVCELCRILEQKG